MKQIHQAAVVSVIMLVATGCSTTGHFRVPPDSQLYVMGRAVALEPGGTVTTHPFSWGGAGGIPYRLEKNGKEVQNGRLRSKFRVVSIFWPPLGAIYWPMGFNPRITYDLVSQTQK